MVAFFIAQEAVVDGCTRLPRDDFDPAEQQGAEPVCQAMHGLQDVRFTGKLQLPNSSVWGCTLSSLADAFLTEGCSITSSSQVAECAFGACTGPDLSRPTKVLALRCLRGTLYDVLQPGTSPLSIL